MENTTNSPETTGAEQTKSLDSLLDQAVDGENVLGGISAKFNQGDSDRSNTGNGQQSAQYCQRKVGTGTLQSHFDKLSATVTPS